MNIVQKIIQFARECKSELKDKTTWPTKEAVWNSTVVVIVSIVLVSAALFFVDYVIAKGITLITVEYVSNIKKVVKWYTFLLFVFLVFAVPILYAKIKKRYLE